MPLKRGNFECDVAIIGGGIIGTALLYTLAKYSNIKSIALFEKYPELARVNSSSTKNSQTLHFGDIETHFSIRKVRLVKEAAEYLAALLEKHKQGRLYRKFPKMLLAVGEKEITTLNERFQEIKNLFPKLQKIDAKEIARLEPRLIKGRPKNQPVIALYSPDGFAVRFGALARHFSREAQREKGKKIDVFLNEYLKTIQKDREGYLLKTSKRRLHAKVVVFAAGAHSLVFAKLLGYGKEKGILPIVGSFYYSRIPLLKTKVYTVQDPDLPFMPLHADPDINNPDETHIGPIPRIIPFLEKSKPSTLKGFLRTSVYSTKGVASLFALLGKPKVLNYSINSLLQHTPILGKHLFIKEARKIIPSLQLEEIGYSSRFGGARPQLVNIRTKEAEIGESRIVGKNLIFNINPLPGASACLGNALYEADIVVKFLGPEYKFDKESFKKDLTRTDN